MISDEDRKQLGERLRDAREYLGFSQEEVAKYLGVPRSALSMMETGQRKVDALELSRLASLYQRPISQFAGGTEEVSVGAELDYLARQVSALSPDDRRELARFADFLRSRKEKEQEK